MSEIAEMDPAPSSIPATTASSESTSRKKLRTRPVLPPEFKELCDLCRAGKLFDVQRWFTQHTYSEPPWINFRQWPLGIAMEMGFHSLVEVLLQNGLPPDRSALKAALWKRNEDFVNLVLQYGGDVRSVEFSDVVETGSPRLMRLFIERGADMFTGNPIAKGLIRTTRPLLGIYKTYIDKHPQLQYQADLALRHFCDKGNLRGVSLLMWLRANPRAKVPLDEDESEGFWSTSLETAAWNGDLEIIRKLKPDPKKDNVNYLLSRSVWRQRMDTVHYWISLGADINSRGEDGSSIHHDVMLKLEWALDTRFSWSSATESKRFVTEWFSLGAKWSPEQRDTRIIRKCISRLSYMEAYELIKLFRKREVMSLDALATLLNTPKLRKHLSARRKAIAELIPQLARWVI